MTRTIKSSRSVAGMPATAPGSRIGLLGGSFNPAHDGHRHISLEALRRLELNQVWWLVSAGNPLKENDDLPPLNTRAAAAAHVAQHPDIIVTGLEQDLGSALTADTVAHLQKRAPAVRFVWLMGGDNLIEFHRWARWRELARLIPMAVFDRPGTRNAALASVAAKTFEHCRLPSDEARLLADRHPPAWTYLDIPLLDRSSTSIRAGKQG